MYKIDRRGGGVQKSYTRKLPESPPPPPYDKSYLNSVAELKFNELPCMVAHTEILKYSSFKIHEFFICEMYKENRANPN